MFFAAVYSIINAGDEMLNTLMNILLSAVQNFLYYAPILILSITVHEFCHAYTAKRLGDDTAYLQGRVTLNPLKHLDPVGAVCMFLFGFGWGRAVPISVLNFRNPKRDSAIVSLMGPLSNLALACIFGLIFGLVSPFMEPYGHVFMFLYYGIYLNCVLCVFNLLPIAPLDGSRILSLILPDRWYYKLIKYERVMFAVLVVLMFIGVFSPVIRFLAGGVFKGISYTFMWFGEWVMRAILRI